MSSAPMVPKLSCTSYSSFLASTRPPRSTKCPCKGFFLERKVGKILSVPLKLGKSKSKNCFASLSLNQLTVFLSLVFKAQILTKVSLNQECTVLPCNIIGDYVIHVELQEGLGTWTVK